MWWCGQVVLDWEVEGAVLGGLAGLLVEMYRVRYELGRGGHLSPGHWSVSKLDQVRRKEADDAQVSLLDRFLLGLRATGLAVGSVSCRMLSSCDLRRHLDHPIQIAGTPFSLSRHAHRFMGY